MFERPTSPELSAEQRRELDDTFLSSDPFSYFRARIEMTLQWAEWDGAPSVATASQDRDPGRDDIRPRLHALLGGSAQGRPAVSSRTIATQVATDAYALRHHAAESLVRLAAVVAQNLDNPDVCVWEQLSASPTRIQQVLEQLENALSSDGAPRRFASMVLRDAALRDGFPDPLGIATNVFADWLQFSSDLLTGTELDLNAVNNKVKHGLAARARDDLKMVLTSVPPNSDGTITLSSLTGPNAFDIFDRPVIEALSRAPKVDGHRQGLEVSRIRVDAAQVLAQAHMIAWTHGAMFHVAASKHFEGRRGLPEYLRAPEHPGYPMGGPRPSHVTNNRPVGIRAPLTTPQAEGLRADQQVSPSLTRSLHSMSLGRRFMTSRSSTMLQVALRRRNRPESRQQPLRPPWHFRLWPFPREHLFDYRITPPT